MLSDERVALEAQLEATNAEMRDATRALDKATDRKRALARRYVMEVLIPATPWEIAENGESLRAMDGTLARKIAPLFNERFAHFGVSLQAASDDLALSGIAAYARWASERAEVVRELHQEYLLDELRFTPDVPLDDDYRTMLSVDDGDVILRCGTVEALLALIETHGLNLRWEGARERVEAAERSAEAARTRADALRAKLAPFLS